MVSDSDRSVVVVGDERWPGETHWMYLGSLFVDTRFVTEVSNAFLNARYACDGWDTVRTDDAWRDADRDDHVVTFDRCDRDVHRDIAERWLTLLRQRFDVTDRMKVRLTGVALGRLNGPTDPKSVYRRVLRNHLIDARTHFFGESIQVDYDRICHREGDEERNDAFAAVMDTVNDPLTGIGDLQFRTMDHTQYKPGTRGWRISHLLQLVNVVIGATAHLFTDRHLVHNRAKLSWMQKDLAQDSMAYEEPAVDRFSLSFYPEDEGGDRFYYWRDVQRSDPHKESLERFM